MSEDNSVQSWSAPPRRSVRVENAGEISAMHVLLVEDSVIFAEAVRLLLMGAAPIEVDLCHVERLADVSPDMEPKPDVVLLDLALPDAQGLDTIRGMQVRLPGTPIVVLTADSNEQLALDVVRGGAQDYLVKGRFNVDTLVRTMRYAIERVQGEQLKRQLLQADRLAAIGRLAAGVAHEISNPATFVQASATLVREQFMRLEAALARLDRVRDRDGEGAADLTKILEEARGATEELRRLTDQNAAGVERICAVVQDLRGYSRLEPGKVVLVHPNDVISDVCNLVSSVVRHKARLVKDLKAVPPVALPRGRLDQILTNLLVNAAQAIPDAPPQENTITVSTRCERIDVVITVEDTGVGMTPEQQKKVFEPFFTTKARGVGTGLGLSICREIARAHQGEVTCASELSCGTRFEVRFPVVSEHEVRVPTPAPPPAEQPVGRVRVLIVDDEPNIRQVYAVLLSDEFDVETAKNGTDALSIIQKGPRFDVIVSDLMMPDMDAAELMGALLAVEPTMMERFILYTGGAVSDRARRLVDTGEVPVLYKPLLIDELKRAIRARLSDR
ncbi:MAG: response regulator [Polyangiaceae bacterium]|nr:response regulator [Polyangiaceae bacterium]